MSRACSWRAAIAGHELADQAQRRVDVEVDAPLGRLDEQVGKADAGDGVGDDGERRVPIGQPLDGAHPHERRVAERRKPADALAQRELEGRDAASSSRTHSTSSVSEPLGSRM